MRISLAPQPARPRKSVFRSTRSSPSGRPVRYPWVHVFTGWLGFRMLHPGLCRGGSPADLHQRRRRLPVRLLVHPVGTEELHLVLADRGQGHDLRLGPFRFLVLSPQRLLQRPQPRQLAVRKRRSRTGIARHPGPAQNFTVLKRRRNISPIKMRSMSFCFGLGWHARQIQVVKASS